ncbi:hypothetical protein VIBNISO65_1490032 [Vibrio nigripulchritudo SO65]|nr:hypothetical protein VIBNIAM115_930032 [Vibrio nigripulchritudo AM115]CCN44238.1 hypothetical protein VIBNIFTn2_730009 [Vibrio nigripulchritudo FTn2]CCN67722.1 hypothetical protein VIBNIPon4_860009 [Vibrio nigripulchritudo POn4]CCN76028.1 hypothetical protein VIBNISO65_1490032 [Vibrio nigripulchritudo SO65]
MKFEGYNVFCYYLDQNTGSNTLIFNILSLIYKKPPSKASYRYGG